MKKKKKKFRTVAAPKAEATRARIITSQKLQSKLRKLFRMNYDGK